MSAEQKGASKQDIHRRFKRLSESLRPSVTLEQWLVRESVAVRIDYALNEMRPTVDAGEMSDAMQEAIRRVLAESKVIYAADRTPLWRLDHGVRHETLLRLSTEGRLLEVLNANPAATKSFLQEMFDATIRGDVPAIEDQSLPQLEAMLQVVIWLDGCLPDLPDKTRLHQQMAYERLVEPFRFLVGRHFSGRDKELALLRDYITVSDEATFVAEHQELLNRAKRSVPGTAAGDLLQQPTNDSHTKPKPLFIYGMGGIGKSTLLSYLILDPENSAGEKHPFVYIDFNRSDIDLENPVYILTEATRQLAIQNPIDEERWCKLGDEYRSAMKELAEDSGQYDAESVASFRMREWERYMYEFIELLQSIQPPEKPFLLVLDTMEELLFHSINYLGGLWEFLELLQDKLPGMRRILSGRTPLPDQFPVYNLLLNRLDEDSAIKVLRKRNVPDKAGKQIVASVGRIPLNLWLAAELYDRLPEEEKSFEALETRNSYFYQVKEYLIQGLLYRRILSYMHDDDKRLYQLAHPGLVLRRITPDLILNVLAKACDIEVNNLDQARDLFDRLRREVAIVEIDNARPDELRHRPELRLVMLELLMQDELAQVNEIHRVAIEYLKRRISEKPDPDIRDRADYLYHHLAIREDKVFDPLIFEDYSKSELQAIADELGRVIEDLPVEIQTVLVSRVKINIRLDESVWETADLISWEHKTARSVSALLNRRLYEEALSRLAERSDRSPESPLLQPEIAALLGLKRIDEALQVITDGIQQAPPYSQTMQMLCIQEASILEAQSKYAVALKTYRRGLKISERREDKIEILRIQLFITRMSHSVYNADDEAARALEETKLLACWDALEDQELVGHSTLVRDVASQMAAQKPQTVARALRLVDWHKTPPDNIEHLARSLSSWDDLRSGETEEEPGILARAVKAPWGGDLYTTWLKFLQETDWDRASRRLQKLFTKVHLTPTLAITLVDLIKARLLLTTEEANLLQQTLKAAFHPDNLSTLLESEFDNPLSEITRATDYERRIADVISWAESTGRLATLLRAVRAVSPQQPQLLTLLDRLGLDTGLTTAAVDPEAAIPLLAQVARQANQNGDQLQEFEARVQLGCAYLDRKQGEEYANNKNALEAFLAARSILDSKADSRISALLYSGLGTVYQRENQIGKAVAAHEQALQIRQKIGDRAGEINSLASLVNTLYGAGFYKKAQAYMEKTLYIARLTENRIEVGNQLGNLGLVYYKLGMTEEAIELYRDAIAVRHEVGDRHGEAADLSNLGNAFRDLNQLEKAANFHKQALGISRSLGDHNSVVTDLTNLGTVYAAKGNYDQAANTLKEALASDEKFLGSGSIKTASIFNALGKLQQTIGNFKSSQSYFERAIEIKKDKLGPDHPDTAASLNNLGGLLQEMGSFAQAQPLLERSLAIREEQLGPEHRDTAASLNNLGGLLQAQGEYEAARPYYERALAIQEKTMGPEHPDTAASLNNLGALLDSQGDYEAARPYYERALAIRENALGPEHPDTAESLNNLGGLLQTLGEYEAARLNYERALTINEKALGPEHPDTAASLNNLGGLLQAQGDYEAARPYYERALAIREKALGPEHPDTAESLNDFGGLLYEKGNYEAARPYYERALAIRENALGPEHPDTAASLNNLGALLDSQGDYEAARPYYERALAIRENALGPEHPDTGLSLNNLGALLYAQGEYEAARPYYKRAFTINERTLGSVHPNTADTLNNLGLLLQARGEYEAARSYYERALTIREKALGPEHPETAVSLNNIGGLLYAEGEYKATRPYYERALAIREKALGSKHPETAQSLYNLGKLLQVQEKYKAARLYYKSAFDILKHSLGPNHPNTIAVWENLSQQTSEERDAPDFSKGHTIFSQQGQKVSGGQINIGQMGGDVKITGDVQAGRDIYIGDVHRDSPIDVTGKGSEKEASSVGRLELIEQSGRVMATAFLVAPDLIMTPFHVVGSLINQKLPPEDITIRFDLLETGSKSVVSQGQAYALAVGKEAKKRHRRKLPWIFAYDEEIDFAILRLTSEAGKDVVGGLRKGRRRGWLRLSSEVDINEKESLRMIGFDQSGRIKVEIFRGNEISLFDDGKRLRYRLARRLGTSGAPLLNMSGYVVGMHILFSPEADASEAVSMSAIYEHLKQRRLKLEAFRL